MADCLRKYPNEMISGLTLEQINDFFGEEIVELTDVQETLPGEIDYLNPSQMSSTEQPGPLNSRFGPIPIWKTVNLK